MARVTIMVVVACFQAARTVEKEEGKERKRGDIGRKKGMRLINLD